MADTLTTQSTGWSTNWIFEAVILLILFFFFVVAVSSFWWWCW